MITWLAKSAPSFSNLIVYETKLLLFVLVGAVQSALISPPVEVVDNTGFSGVEGTSASVNAADLSEVAPVAPAAVITVTVNSTLDPYERAVKVLFVDVPSTNSSLDELTSVTL